MAQSDYSVYNLPALLGRSVKKQDPKNPDRWIRDDDWYREIQQMHFSLFCFLQANGLVSRELVKTLDDTSAVVLKQSELTDLGRRFIKSGADERWLKSFDRPGSKKDFSSTEYMRKALAKLGGGAAK